MTMTCQVIVDLKPDTPCGKPAVPACQGPVPMCAPHEWLWNNKDPLMVVFHQAPSKPASLARD